LKGPDVTQGFLKKDTRVLLVAIVLGVLGVILLNTYVKGKEKGEEKVAVIAAARDLPQATVLQKGHLQRVDIPRANLSDRMYRPEDVSQLINQGLAVEVPAGQPVLSTYITVGHAGGLSEALSVERHERAVTVRFGDPMTSLLKTGDRIDIMATVNAGGRDVTTMVLPNVYVMNRVGADVIVRAKPDEGRLLIFASEKCRLSFMLRNPQDIAIDTADRDVDFGNIVDMGQRFTARRATDPIMRGY